MFKTELDDNESHKLQNASREYSWQQEAMFSAFAGRNIQKQANI